MNDKEAIQNISNEIELFYPCGLPFILRKSINHIEARLGQLQELEAEAEPKPVTLDMVNNAGKQKAEKIGGNNES